LNQNFKSMNFFRALLCIFLPPLAVLE